MKNAARVVIACVVTIVFAIPLYLALVNAFKPNSQIQLSPAALPDPVTVDNFINVLTAPSGLFWQGLLNSLVIVIPTMAATSVFGALGGYYLARSTSLVSRLSGAILLIGLMLPFQVLLLPLSIVLKQLGLQGTLFGIILFNVAFYVPFAAFVYARFIQSVPRELEEAAAIDGAGRLRTFAQVVVPLLKPTTASVLIFIGVWVWNDFLNPLVLLGPSGGRTITTGLYVAIGQFNTDFGTMFALMLLAVLPILVFFLLLQKRFVAGLTAGATKG
ncbi:carbohydrate ABC transporter permease [Microbacterium sp. NPDC057407]|uniref:carbohydrate ABC transporter permease n=1 Tax=Microbacterium sp. NPDC057407 TaxID=3346120 RepID=UPI003670B3C2